MKKIYFFILLMVFYGIAFAGTTLKFGWGPNEEPISGYRLYVSASEEFLLEGSPRDIPLDSLGDTKFPSYVFTDIPDGVWYFGVTAYNGTYESTPSNVLIIETCESCRGDFDKDGDIDAKDMSIFIKNFGKTHE